MSENISLQTDEELVTLTQKGNLRAFETIVRRYQKLIYSHAYRLLGDPQESFDAAQEVFIRAFKNIQSFDSTKKLRPWLYAIASNYCRDYVRKTSRLRALPDEVEGQDEYETIMDRLIQEEQHKKLHLALLQLPATYRLPIEQYYWRNLSYQAIAIYNQLPLNTVRTRIRRGKEILGKILKRN